MPSLVSRRARLVASIAAFLVVAGAFGFWLRTSSLVRVEQVTVTGVDGSQARAIRDALTAAALDMTTLAVDDARLLDAVATYPVVRSVRASADFPHRLRIDVNAYEPIAAVRSRGGATTAVSGGGKLLRGTPTKGLPVVAIKVSPGGGRVGDRVDLEAIRLVAAAPAPLRRRVAQLFRGPRGLTATVDDGPKLLFGGGDRPRAKWAAVVAVLSHDGARNATYVDVRIPERAVAGGFQPRPVEISPSTLG